MAVILNKLTDRKLRSNMSSGHHADGGGLYIRVKKSGAKSWAFRWKRNGRVREIGLGGYPTVSLDTARSIAKQHRDTLANGEVPKPFGKMESIPTFSEVVNEFLADKESQWSNPKHRQQWRNTLEQYCHKIASKLVSEIDLTDVMIILKPIWKEKPETASRLRGRIEKVLAYATIKKYRTGVNPAVWKGNLEHILPKPEKLSRGHHKAMPYDKLPEFFRSLDIAEGKAAKALQLLILTASRTSEIIEARWDEFEIQKGLWVIPAERMKMRREHRIPLTAPAIDVVKSMEQFRENEFVFPSQKRNKPLSNMAMAELIKGMDIKNVTVHGFRSSFRDWAGDESNAPREVIEGCLAHKVGDETERAYRRSDALEKKRILLNQWADYCIGQNNVVALRA